MTMKHTRSIQAAIIIFLMAFALVACGGATIPASTSTGTSAPTTIPVAAAPAGAATAGAGSAPTSPSSQAASPAPEIATPADAATTAPETPAASSGEQFTNTKLNLNEVTDQELLSTIPNFGNRMVREFFEYRPYISIQQFHREIGKYVSAEQVAEYEQYVYVPIDVDAADAATLQQLPGVDATIAADLIAGRPYGSNQAFLAKLAAHVSAANAASAETYLVAK